MCHYTYTLYVCCDEPKEYDGVRVLEVEYCDSCPISSDGRLFDDDFFHCPYATGECLGDSMYRCEECSEARNMEHDHDGLNVDKEPDGDEFSDCSDEEDVGFGALPPERL